MKQVHSLPKIKIAIIGGGWYGCHAAESIMSQKPGSLVTIFEKGSDIFSGISGTFGNRLHVGTHYPRSSLTRELCHEGYKEFYIKYPELINEHSHSLYGLGVKDAGGNPSKVNKEEFAAVCQEFGEAKEIPITDNYPNLYYVADIKEPSLVMGIQLRNFFKKRLKDLGVDIHCNVVILSLKKSEDSKFILETPQKEFLKFDFVINATSFKTLLPSELHFNIFYQACFALVYEQNSPTTLPFSFIVMDGNFPSLMPYDDRPDKNTPISKYVLTHASITLSKPCKTLEDAKNIYSKMHLSMKDIKSNCENELMRFYPKFDKEFTYIDYMGVILAKVKTLEDFRGAVTFKSGGIIYFIPGKISNVFQASREALSLINSENIITEENYSYVEGGILDRVKKSAIKQPAISTSSFFRQNASNEPMSCEEGINSLNIKR
jgi:hypothetical protein